MPGPTTHRPPEFKKEAVRLHRSSNRSIPKMAEEFGIASESIKRWDGLHRHPALSMLAYRDELQLDRGPFPHLWSGIGGGARDTAGDPQANYGVAARRTDSVVHGDGSNRNLPSGDLPGEQKLTK